MSNQTAEEIKSIIREKVEGKIVADHDATGHHYVFVETGLRVDSVTTKLIIDKPHLREWAVKKGVEWLMEYDRLDRLKACDEIERRALISGAQKAHTEYRDDAGSVGTLAHAVIEKYILYWLAHGTPPEDIRKGFKDGADPRAIAAARAVEQLFRKHDVVPIASELLVGSQKIGCAGTLDFLCLWDGKLTLVDWKTSNHVQDDYALQVAAYKYFLYEMTGLEIEDCKLAHISKDADKFKLYRIPYINRAYAVFKANAVVYDWLTDGRAKLESDVKAKKVAW